MIRLMLVLATVIAINTAIGFSGGTGTPQDPYRIVNANDLASVNDDLSASYILTADIDLSAQTYNKAVIAHSNQFTGSFDGSGYIITGLNIIANVNNIGLFGQTSGAAITNLAIEQAEISAPKKDNIAVLCGYSFNGTTISNCYVTGTVSGGTSVGGLVGYNQLSTIQNCYSLCSVIGDSKGSRVGGLVGYNFNNSPVTDCYATGNISGNNEVGGLIGKNQTTIIANCYATGEVTGSNFIGGLFGYNQTGVTTNCYATGNISGDENSGGLCGYNWEGSFTNCYAQGNIQGESYNGGFVGYNIRGAITECYAIGTITGIDRSQYSGGFVGRNDTGAISYCYATGNVTAKDFNGGFAGYNSGGPITVCFAQGNVIGSGDYSGGFVGAVNAGVISNSFASGNVTGKSYTAGFCGIIYTAAGSINNSYCIGYINGNGNYIGCFLGVTWSGSLSGCLWDMETSGLGCSGFNGATGKTTAQMQDINTFNAANWNFIDSWVMSAAGYPQHKWLNIEIPMEGTGTKTDPYRIAVQEHLEQVNKDLTAYYILVADINLSSTVYTTAIIAPDTDNAGFTHEGGAFVGSFDGNGFAITGVKIDTQGQSNNYLGLFGYISMGSVKNVVLEDVSITAGSNSRYVGALAGYNSSTAVNNCMADGVIQTGDNGGYYGGLIGRNGGNVTNCFSIVQLTAGSKSSYIGGLIGYNYMTAKLVNCYAGGDVYADDNSESIGGLVGRNWFGIISDSHSDAFVQSGSDTLYIGCLCGYNSGTITGSFATGDISTLGKFVGNLCGYNYYGTLINCYSVGDILTAGSYVGGLCGVNFKGFVMDCYAAGQVNGGSDLGGLFATQTLSMTISSFWDTETTGQAASAGGTGITTVQMQDISTFLAVGWDFVNYWAIDADEYPVLLYPNIPVPNKPAKFSGGSGTIGNPYQIGNVADWQELMNTSLVWDKYFIVIKNINLKDVELTTVGNETTNFTGSFDGCGYKISNASMITAYDNQALFGVTNGASITNLALENVTIAGRQVVAALVASASNTAITKCSATGIITSQSGESGALAAVCENGTVTDCFTNVMIQGDGNGVGGLVGRSSNSTITGCYALGDTFGNGNEMGGLVGRSENGGLISKSYATGTVTGSGTTSRIGGLVGGCYNSQIVNSYATVDVIGFDNVGGLVGESVNSAITNCYAASNVSSTASGVIGGLIATDNGSTVIQSFWDVDVSALYQSAAGTGIVTPDMQMIDLYLISGWDFTNVWWIPSAGYPRIQTQMKGIGTQTNPYQIENQFHLELVNNDLVKKHYILMADIDLSATIYSTAIIAPDENGATPEFEGTSFSGVFDGNGHKITGLTINTNGERSNYLGLFGRINDGSVRNLALENINITAGDNCWYIGGISGWNNSVIMTNCYTQGNITAGEYTEAIGGLVGDNHGTITTCYSDVVISSAKGAKFIGGLVGWNGGSGSGKKGDITNCYAKGNINGTLGAYKDPWTPGGSGGLVGKNWFGTISNCYADTQITNAPQTGGFCGYSNNDAVVNCFWNAETTAIAVSSGAAALTTAQMLDNETFTAAGWDFAGRWMQMIDVYPTLVFENTLFPQEAKPLNANNIDAIMFVMENWLTPVGETTMDINQNSDDALIDMRIFSTLANQVNGD